METVLSCTKVRDWTSKEGKLVPIYSVALSDGQGGESFGKEIPVGTPMSEITITPNPPYGNKITLKNPGGGYSGRQRSGNESFALSYAKDIVCAGKADLKNVFDLADKMYLWLEKKKGATPSNPVVLASTLPPKVNIENDSSSLPF